ncbi:hypothetical protein ACIQ7Q_12850 [Streptomyces sp. NPDC096176]|uniref:hypothetical protein n=1 Tax=Streptomyces sp. NPDC096176 TaxID=3366079 RepID=UPI003810DCF6
MPARPTRPTHPARPPRLTRPARPAAPTHPTRPARPAPSAGPAASTHRSLGPSTRASDPAGDIVRWAAFSCLLVPVVLVAYGTSVGGAAVAALGLAAVTAACRVLLRHSERAAARSRDKEGRPPRGHRSRTVPRARRSARHGAGSAPRD